MFSHSASQFLVVAQGESASPAAFLSHFCLSGGHGFSRAGTIVKPQYAIPAALSSPTPLFAQLRDVRRMVLAVPGIEKQHPV